MLLQDTTANGRKGQLLPDTSGEGCKGDPAGSGLPLLTNYVQHTAGDKTRNQPLHATQFALGPAQGLPVPNSAGEHVVASRGPLHPQSYGVQVRSKTQVRIDLRMSTRFQNLKFELI